jgi:nucleotide-binding universal stress UspA family protein
VTAEAQIRETHVGHVRPGHPGGCRRADALVIVIGAAGHTDLPRIPLGGVWHGLLHLSRRRLLIVPRRTSDHAAPEPTAAQAAQPVAV